MKKIVITRYGGPNVLQVQEGANPNPRDGEIRISVRAIGVNFSDILARVGLYPDAPKPPSVVGYEVAGVVDALGAGVNTWQVGDRVMAVSDFGAYTDSLVIPHDLAFAIPGKLSFAEAASVPVTYLTAILSLYKLANLEAGETVLIHGAAGGVGIAAMQLARLRGAIIIGTASPHKHEKVRELGADHVFDYRRADLSKKIRAVTDGRGVDIVLDPIGGKNLRASYKLLAPLGRVVTYGASDALPGSRRRIFQVLRAFFLMPIFHPLSLLHDNRSVHGLHLGRLFDEAPKLTKLMEYILEQLEAGSLQPIVGRTFPFDEVAEAHQFMHDRKNIGKVLLIP